jgi:hypothetical protein
MCMKSHEFQIAASLFRLTRLCIRRIGFPS